ncbi:hypothetical protein SAMN05421761_12411 [Belliella pelovolcani]|uniref:Uncharacterized protein n=1 Tax=Belliella pelovolcani TaxID=529505 RepID=A0A1N7Q0C3_9BACT|nr:hypothetical protein SAMN05421761_12411 [Belliella pelovolcani]
MQPFKKFKFKLRCDFLYQMRTVGQQLDLKMKQYLGYLIAPNFNFDSIY